jgi:pyruvate/2-oxoglutarate dehydrogenase complex dihydrolipoamide acyltransferase (E2) component
MSDDSVDISSMTEEERLRYEKKQRKAAKMAAEAEAQAAAAAEAEAAEEERREQKSATKAAKAVRAAAAEEQVNTGKKRKLEREDDAAPTESKKQKTQVAWGGAMFVSYVLCSFSCVSSLTQLQKLDASIQGVQVSIENNEAELKITKNPQDKQYLQQTVLQLREEKKQLRDELKRLCDIEQQQKSNVDKRTFVLLFLFFFLNLRELSLGAILTRFCC